ncbi:MAG: hypothetical protein EOL98_07955 [Negativicutes bacterium]|nr:hypothetical protein [Negativicutes bacterium]
MAQCLDESAVLGLLAATMKQQAESSWIFRPAFLDAEKNVSGYHDGRVSNESVEVPALAAFFQLHKRCLVVRKNASMSHRLPYAGNVVIGKGDVSGK